MLPEGGLAWHCVAAIYAVAVRIFDVKLRYINIVTVFCNHNADAVKLNAERGK